MLRPSFPFQTQTAAGSSKWLFITRAALLELAVVEKRLAMRPRDGFVITSRAQGKTLHSGRSGVSLCGLGLITYLGALLDPTLLSTVLV